MVVNEPLVLDALRAWVPDRRGHRISTAARARRGVTFVELLIALSVLSIALVFFGGTVGAVSRQRAILRENAIAREAARTVLETMRAMDFSEVWPAYNADPADDPGGNGTAPGNTFPVAGLDPAENDADGIQGEVLFPVAPGGGGRPELREDVADRDLGLPRDLNGDSIVDGRNHAGDYFLLPVRIRVRWQGIAGERIVDTCAQLCEFNKQ